MPDERFMVHHYGASGYVPPTDATTTRRAEIEKRLAEIERIFNEPWADAWTLGKEGSRLRAELAALAAAEPAPRAS